MNLTLKQMARFYDSFDIIPDGCWVWKKLCSSNGYGNFSINKKTFYAHRISYELYNDPIPEGLVIDHLCRNRRCVNPEHLEVVTQRENISRGVGYGRGCASKTHCFNGHPYIESNIYFRKSKTGAISRCCKICHKEGRRKSNLKKKLVLATSTNG